MPNKIKCLRNDLCNNCIKRNLFLQRAEDGIWQLGIIYYLKIICNFYFFYLFIFIYSSLTIILLLLCIYSNILYIVYIIML